MRLLLSLVALGLLFSSAARAEPRPLRLRIAVNDVFCKRTACSCAHAVANREYDDFLVALKKRSGIELDLVYFSEPYELVAAVSQGRFDGAIAKPWLLLRLEGQGGSRFLRLADLQDTGGNPWLWGQVLVLKDSPVRTLEEAQGLALAIGQDDGYEKHQAVKALLRERAPAWPASKIITRASCLENLDLLLRKQVDVAVISNYALSADCGVDVASSDQFRVIAETEKIPLTSFMVDRGKVDEPDCVRLKEALLELYGERLPASMKGGFVEAAPWTPLR